MDIVIYVRMLSELCEDTVELVCESDPFVFGVDIPPQRAIRRCAHKAFLVYDEKFNITNTVFA